MWQSTSSSFFYDADQMAASYCGLRRTPAAAYGFWKHGWTPRYWQFDPEIILSINAPHNENDYYWVSRPDEEEYVRKCGYKNVKAIGLPVVYVPHINVQRIPGSLLVMPNHSVASTSYKWDFDEYAEHIHKMRKDFSEIIVCLHPVCWERGYWIDAFRTRGFEVIQAVNSGWVTGHHTLERVCRLFSSFEYVTTNSLGSSLVYGSYLGAKVSISGPWAVEEAHENASDPFFVRNPHLLEPVTHARTEATVRDHYPDLFCHPLAASQRVEWGRHEIGYYNKVTPAEMRSLFRWRSFDRAVYSTRAAVPEPVRHCVRWLLRPEYRRTKLGPRALSTRTEQE